jgi:hypothetical protein
VAAGTAGKGGSGGGGAGGLLGWELFDIRDAGLRWQLYSLPETFDHPTSTGAFDTLISNAGNPTASGRASIVRPSAPAPPGNNILDWESSSQLATVTGATIPNSGDRFAFVVHGAFIPKETGTYTFSLESDDNADLFINTNSSSTFSGSPVVSFYGSSGRGTNSLGTTTGTIDLTAGRVYRFRVRQEERSGGEGLRLFWRKPSQGSNWFQDPEEMPATPYHPGNTAEFNALLGAAIRVASGTGAITTQSNTNTANVLNWNSLAQLEAATVNRLPESGRPAVPNSGDSFSVVVTGSFVPSETGSYTFTVAGDDAVDVSIDGTVVASHYGGHAISDLGVAGQTGSINLVKGNVYRLRVRHEDGDGNQGLRMFWRKPSQTTGWHQDSVELTGVGRAGEPNTGGGGGAGGFQGNANDNVNTNLPGGAGGSGVVILRYRV